jgi:ATP-dependent Clp protease protease subunit
MPYYIPTVIEKSGSTERTYDIYSRLIKDRIIFLGTEIDDDVSNAVVAQLLFLETQDPGKEISLWINSPGGVITSGLAIYDTMNFITSPVKTVCIGQACSMGAFLLSAGEKGRRVSLPHSTIMIHQPLGGAGGQATDIEITNNEIQRLKKLLTTKISEHSGQEYEKMLHLMERDKFLTPEMALELGIIDSIVGKI